MLKKLSAVLALLFLFFAISGCSSPENPPDIENNPNAAEAEEEKEAINIGVLITESGDYSENGKREMLGLLFANSLVKDASVNGSQYKLQLMFSNDIKDSGSAAAEAKRLAKTSKAIIDISGGKYAEDTTTIFRKKDIPVLSVSAYPGKVLEECPNASSLMKSDEYIGNKTANHVFKTLKMKSAFVICPAGDSGSLESAFFFSQRMLRLGGKSAFASFDGKLKNLSSCIDQAKKYKALVVFSPICYAENILKAAVDAGIKCVVSAPEWNDRTLIERYSDKTEISLIISETYSEQSWEFKNFSSWLKSEGSFMPEYNHPSGIAFNAFNAYNVVVEKLESS